MRFLRRTAPAAPDVDVLGLAALKDACERGKRKAYRDGLGDGMAEILDQLEGRSKFAQSDVPEATDELRYWIATIRARLDQVRAEDRAA